MKTRISRKENLCAISSHPTTFSVFYERPLCEKKNLHYGGGKREEFLCSCPLTRRKRAVPTAASSRNPTGNGPNFPYLTVTLTGVPTLPNASKGATA